MNAVDSVQMGDLRALTDRCLPEILRQSEGLVAAGADARAIVAVVLHATVSPDGWPMLRVCCDAGTARAYLATIDPLLAGVALGGPGWEVPGEPARPPPLVVAVARVAGALVCEATALTVAPVPA